MKLETFKKMGSAKMLRRRTTWEESCDWDNAMRKKNLKRISYQVSATGGEVKKYLRKQFEIDSA